jgi:hypothetical protein
LAGLILPERRIHTLRLDHYWGDVAVVVATGASDDVNAVIRRQSGHDPNEMKQSTK